MRMLVTIAQLSLQKLKLLLHCVYEERKQLNS